LEAAYDEAGLPDEQRSELSERVRPHLEYVVGDVAVNPREVKRYINGFTLLRKVSAELDLDAVLAWQTIDFREEWAPVRSAILEYGPLFTRAVGALLEKEATALVDLDPELDQIPDDFLDYVAPEAPGHALLEVDNLDPYVYSGAAVRSTLNPRLLDAIRAAGEVRRKLFEARRRSSLSAAALSELRKGASSARSLISVTGQGPLVFRVLEGIETFEQRASELERRLEGEQALAWEEVAPTVDELDQLLRQVRDRLQKLYRAGDLSGPTAADAEPVMKMS
jgi:hypothetical protein